MPEPTHDESDRIPLPDVGTAEEQLEADRLVDQAAADARLDGKLGLARDQLLAAPTHQPCDVCYFHPSSTVLAALHIAEKSEEAHVMWPVPDWTPGDPRCFMATSKSKQWIEPNRRR